MGDAKLKKYENKILHIPICLGAVALSYNLPEVGEIKLSNRLGKDHKYVPKDMDTRVPVYITRLKSSKKGSKPRLTYFAFFPQGKATT